MLTQAQYDTLKTAILADPALVDYVTNGNDYEIAEYLNEDSAYIVWRTHVDPRDIEQNGFAWASIDEVPETKWRIWERLTAYGIIDFSKTNVRQGLIDFAKNSAGQPVTALRNSILPYTKRAATRAEELFITGQGAGTDPNPDILGWEGEISSLDVAIALRG